MTLAETNILPRLDDTSQHLANSYHDCQWCKYEIINWVDWFQRYPWQNSRVCSLDYEEISQYLTQYVQISMKVFHYC